MKRGTKLLTLLAVLALLAVGALAAASLNPDNASGQEETAFTLLTIDPEAVTAIGWDYSEAVSFTAGENGWEYTDDSRFPLDESYIDTILDTISQITASKTIESPEELDQYGLEVPICTVTVSADREYTLSIGEATSVSGERYFAIGDGNVYLVPSTVLSCFQYELYDLIAYEQIPEMAQILSAGLESESRSWQIAYLEESGIAYSDSYTWFMQQQDGYRTLDTQLTSNFLASVTQFDWDSCADYYAEAEELESYGLDTPAALLKVEYLSAEETEERFVLALGATVDGMTYARLGTSNMVYLVDDGICESLLYTTYQELMPDEVLLLDWTEAEEVTITLDAESYTAVKEVRQTQDEEGNVTEETVWLLDGEELALEEVLDELTGMASTGYANGVVPEGAEELRVRILRDREQYGELELVFWQYDSSADLVTLNGEATVFTARADVAALAEAVRALVE